MCSRYCTYIIPKAPDRCYRCDTTGHVCTHWAGGHIGEVFVSRFDYVLVEQVVTLEKCL